MSTATMKAKRNMGEKSVSEIIASARTIRSLTKARVGSRGVLGMSMLAGLLLWLSFTPVNASPLAWLAPLPLLLLVRIEDRTRWMSVSIYFGSLFSQLAMLQWMRLGDPTMYIAWWALSAYLATYMVAFVAISRVAVHRLSLPLVLVGPVVWTSLEYLRAHLLTGGSLWSQFCDCHECCRSDIDGAAHLADSAAAGTSFDGTSHRFRPDIVPIDSGDKYLRRICRDTRLWLRPSGAGRLSTGAENCTDSGEFSRLVAGRARFS